MRIYGLVQDSIVDGPGLRFACFVQGCPHHCPGCHNPDSHDFNAGQEIPIENIIETMRQNPLTDGLTLSGGEPFTQPEECLTLAEAAHKLGLNVWSYSGWTFEYLLEHGTEDQKELLYELDVLVDGPFIEPQKTLALPWRGSRNQRVIDVQKSLQSGKIILIPD